MTTTLQNTTTGVFLCLNIEGGSAEIQYQSLILASNREEAKNKAIEDYCLHEDKETLHYILNGKPLKDLTGDMLESYWDQIILTKPKTLYPYEKISI